MQCNVASIGLLRQHIFPELYALAALQPNNLPAFLWQFTTDRIVSVLSSIVNIGLDARVSLFNPGTLGDPPGRPGQFQNRIRVVFPRGLVERGDDLLVYYGAAGVSVAAAGVRKRDLVASLAEAIKLKQGGVPVITTCV